MERVRIAAVPLVRPKLLVSVRDSAEALAAVCGGADIIDVKEPSNGSLGRASSSAIRSIAVRMAAGRAGIVSSNAGTSPAEISEVQLSLALGEVTEWMSEHETWSEEFISLVCGVRPQFLKLGLAGLHQSGDSPAAWTNSWLQVRQQFHGDCAWVAVAYADYIRAQSPCVEVVCAAAAESGCRVLLIDTFEKDNSTLFDFMNPAELIAVRASTTQAGLQLALAGQITERELSSLLLIGPDIIAVRGAVCEKGSRTAAVSEEKVRAFLDAIQAETCTLSGTPSLALPAIAGASTAAEGVGE